jgi:hypothetical protein
MYFVAIQVETTPPADSSFWSSQLFGVLVGALIAGLIALSIETRRHCTDRLRIARDVRREIHTEALRAAYEVQDALIRLTVVESAGPKIHRSTPPKARHETMHAYDRDRDAAYARYDAAWLHLSESVQLERAFGTPDVAAALRDLKGMTEWSAGHLLDRDREGSFTANDYGKVSEYLIDMLSTHAREDVGVGFGVKKTHAPTDNAGHPSWLTMLESERDERSQTDDAGEPPGGSPVPGAR